MSDSVSPAETLAGPRKTRVPKWVRAVATRSRHVPLRVRLVLLTCALVTGALISTGFAATDLLRNSLMNRVDSQLVSASQTLTNEVPRRLGGSRGPAVPGGTAPAANGEPGGAPLTGESAAACATTNTAASATDTRPRLPSPYYVQTSDTAGNPTGYSSIPLDQTDCGPAVPTLDIAAVKAHLGKPFTVSSRSGSGRWRVVVSVMSSGNGSVAVATPLNSVDSTLQQLIEFDVIIGAAVLIVLAGLSYIAVRRSLRPLVDVEHTAAAIAAGDLTQRVPQTDPRTEVGRLAGALNGMLSQIESAFRAREASEQEARTSETRMRRFITDASHELRTPLTSIRGFAELYRMGAVPEESDVDRVMTRIESESTRMGLLVDDLLLLARLDQQRPLERELVDLETIASDAVHDAQAVAPGRDVQLQLSTHEPVLVVGDDARLRQVVGNLVTNALTHTPESAAVTIGLSIDDSEAERFAVLVVADSGPGLSPKDAQRIFERFYRVEESRTRANGGSGLGLSIVAALTAAHGGTTDVETKLGIGSRFRIRLPLAEM
ncbi:MAG TPA: HAMP domain-containing sensor histidine kinase [Acidothermaceae bacterium]